MKRYIQVLAFDDPARGDIYQWGHASDEELSAEELLELWRQERVAEGDMAERESQAEVDAIRQHRHLSVWTDFLEVYACD